MVLNRNQDNGNSAEGLAALYDHWQLGEVWTTANTFYLRQKLPTLRNSRTFTKPEETLNNDTKSALETSYRKHYAHVHVSRRSRNGVDSRTWGLAPMMLGNVREFVSNHGDEFLESEDGELLRLNARNGRTVLPKLGVTWAKQS